MDAEVIWILILISDGLDNCDIAGGGVYPVCPGRMKGRLGGVGGADAVGGGSSPRALREAIKGFSVRVGAVDGAGGGGVLVAWVCRNGGIWGGGGGVRLCWFVVALISSAIVAGFRRAWRFGCGVWLCNGCTGWGMDGVGITRGGGWGWGAGGESWDTWSRISFSWSWGNFCCCRIFWRSRRAFSRCWIEVSSGLIAKSARAVEIRFSISRCNAPRSMGSWNGCPYGWACWVDWCKILVQERTTSLGGKLNTYIVLSITWVLLGDTLVGGLGISWGNLRRGRSVPPGSSSGRRSNSTIPPEDILLASGLLILKRSCSGFDKSILNTAGYFNREHRSGVQGARNRFFPSFQHLIQLFARLRIDERICVHEGLIKVAPQE